MAGEAHFETYPQRSDPAIDPGNPDGPPVSAPTGEYGWRFVSANGEISAAGGEGFTRRADARRAALAHAYTIIRLLVGQQVGLSMDALIPIVDIE